MDTETVKQLETLLLGMDTDNIHIVSYGDDGIGICISDFFPNLARNISGILLAMLHKEMGILAFDVSYTIRANKTPDK